MQTNQIEIETDKQFNINICENIHVYMNVAAAAYEFND